jgi:hypothetical protein
MQSGLQRDMNHLSFGANQSKREVNSHLEIRLAWFQESQ